MYLALRSDMSRIALPRPIQVYVCFGCRGCGSVWTGPTDSFRKPQISATLFFPERSPARNSRISRRVLPLGLDSYTSTWPSYKRSCIEDLTPTSWTGYHTFSGLSKTKFTASASSLTHEAKFPILRSQKRSPYHLSDCHPAHDREDQHLPWSLGLQGQL